MHSLLKPKFFIPVHGEYRHLKRHAELAESLGMPAHHILIAEIGNCVELTEKSMTLAENVPAGTRLIDGEAVEGTAAVEAMQERIKMSKDGLYVVSVAVTGETVINDPSVEIRGVVESENADIAAEVKQVASRAIEQYRFEYGYKNELATAIEKAVKHYIYKKKKQSPIVVVSVVEV